MRRWIFRENETHSRSISMETKNIWARCWIRLQQMAQDAYQEWSITVFGFYIARAHTVI